VWRDIDAVFLMGSDFSVEQVLERASSQCSVRRDAWGVVSTDPVNSGVLIVRPSLQTGVLLCDWLGRAHLKPYSGKGLRD